MLKQLNSAELERQLLQLSDHYRSMILDSLEHEYGDLESWPYTRRKILKLFGDRGLATRVLEIVRQNLGGAL